MTSRHLVSKPHIDLVKFHLEDSILQEIDTPVKVRDGTVLKVNVFRPNQSGRYPVIIAVSPYGKDQVNQAEFYKTLPCAHLGHIATSTRTAFEAPEPSAWVPKGYVVIQGDTRGQGKSEGDTGPYSARDQEDFYDLIEWAGVQIWSNGNVGLSGVSYLATSQWSVAPMRPPHLKAIMPWEGWNDFYRKFYFAGIPETGFMWYLWRQWIEPNHNPKSGYLEPDYLENGRRHPLRDEYWKSRDYELEKIDVPALVCASFSDQGLHTRDTFEGFKRISSRQKWLYNHRRPKWESYYRADAFALQLRFFDHFLKGVDTGMESVPRVRLEINETRDKYKIIHAEQWPLSGTQYTSLYLDARNSSLNREAVASESMADYASDGSEQTIFDFKLDRDADVIGNTKLRLWVSAEESDDMDLFVGLKKFDENGEEVFFLGFGGSNPNDIVARGWLRVSHREFDPKRSQPWQPFLKHERLLKLKPGEIVPVEIEILPSGTTFRKGETLRVVIQGARILPDSTALSFDDIINRGRHRIHTGGRYDSHVLLPIVDATKMTTKGP